MPKRAKYCLPWYSKRSTWCSLQRVRCAGSGASPAHDRTAGDSTGDLRRRSAAVPVAGGRRIRGCPTGDDVRHAGGPLLAATPGAPSWWPRWPSVVVLGGALGGGRALQPPDTAKLRLGDQTFQAGTAEQRAEEVAKRGPFIVRRRVGPPRTAT